MTRHADKKRMIRARMEKTGESYVTAKRNFEGMTSSSPAENLASEDVAVRVLRRALERRAWMLFEADEEPSWFGHAPLFAGLFEAVVGHLGVPPSVVDTAWSRAVARALQVDRDGCEAALVAAEPALVAAGWRPITSPPYEYDLPKGRRAAAAAESTHVINHIDGTATRVTLKLGGRCAVHGGPHHGRVGTVENLRGDFAWIRFHDNGRFGEVETSYLREEDVLFVGSRCASCHQPKRVLQLIDLEPHRRKALRDHARRAHWWMAHADRDVPTAIRDAAFILGGCLRMLGRSAGDHPPRLWFSSTVSTRPACLTCEPLVDRGERWETADVARFATRLSDVRADVLSCAAADDFRAIVPKLAAILAELE